MAEMFSEEFMNGFKDRWNADSALSGALGPFEPLP